MASIRSTVARLAGLLSLLERSILDPVSARLWSKNLVRGRWCFAYFFGCQCWLGGRKLDLSCLRTPPNPHIMSQFATC